MSGWLDNASLHAQIVQHCLRNHDWSNEQLLTECGALTCSQTRFFTLLAKLLHPLTRRDAEQTELAAAISNALKRDTGRRFATNCTRSADCRPSLA
ncbi:hypothetical protein [Burkholderia cenocepacia]